jgi:hypothetical protein
MIAGIQGMADWITVRRTLPASLYAHALLCTCEG